MTVSGETEAGSAGMQPCRGIIWRAHRDDDRSADASLPRSSKNHIGSVDPDALKISARRAECLLTENADSPFHAEPEQLHQRDVPRGFPPLLSHRISAGATGGPSRGVGKDTSQKEDRFLVRE